MRRIGRRKMNSMLGHSKKLNSSVKTSLTCNQGTTANLRKLLRPSCKTTVRKPLTSTILSNQRQKSFSFELIRMSKIIEIRMKSDSWRETKAWRRLSKIEMISCGEKTAVTKTKYLPVKRFFIIFPWNNSKRKKWQNFAKWIQLRTLSANANKSKSLKTSGSRKNSSRMHSIKKRAVWLPQWLTSPSCWARVLR